jgi:RND family efflux transporter MFP subunit
MIKTNTQIVMKNIVLFSFFAIIFFACGNTNKEPASLTKLKAKKSDLISQIDSLSLVLKSVDGEISKLDTLKRFTPVTAFETKTKIFNHFIEVQGNVEADQSVELYPESGGNIIKIYVKEGQKVAKGTVLAQIDNSIIESSIVELQTQLDLATTTFERQQRLWNQNIGSEMQFLQAKAKKEGLENSLKSINAQAKKLKIVAPFSGTIDEIFGKIGGLAVPQMPVLRLVNLNKIHVESEVTETYLKSIKKGTEVELNFPSLGKTITSKVTQVGNFINPNNRSFKVRIDLNNANNDIKANLLADVKIKDFQANGIVLPTTILQKDRLGKTFVFTLKKEGEVYTTQKTYVNVQMSYNNQSFISQGLAKNTLVVDKGSRLIKADEIVTLVD